MSIVAQWGFALLAVVLWLEWEHRKTIRYLFDRIEQLEGAVQGLAHMHTGERAHTAFVAQRSARSMISPEDLASMAAKGLKRFYPHEL